MVKVLPVVGQDWGVAASGDFDGDSTADILWRQASTGRNILWDNALPNAAHAAATVANNGWRIVPYEGERVRPLVSALMPNVDEGNAEHVAPMRIALSHESDQSLAYAFTFDTSAEFSAKLGEDFDIDGPTAGRIPAGDTSLDVPLRIHGDTFPEANEVLVVPWLGMEAGALEVPFPAGLLRNDDANTVWIDRAQTLEGNTGTHALAVKVSLSRPQSTPVTLEVFTRSDAGIFRAKADVDYVSIPSLLATIAPGATRTTFNVIIIGDAINEPLGEGLDIVPRSVAGAILVGDTGSVWIVDDDPPIIP
jgi:hypothetical protein